MRLLKTREVVQILPVRQLDHNLDEPGIERPPETVKTIKRGVPKCSDSMEPASPLQIGIGYLFKPCFRNCHSLACGMCSIQTGYGICDKVRVKGKDMQVDIVYSGASQSSYIVRSIRDPFPGI